MQQERELIYLQIEKKTPQWRIAKLVSQGPIQAAAEMKLAVRSPGAPNTSANEWFDYLRNSYVPTYPKLALTLFSIVLTI